MSSSESITPATRLKSKLDLVQPLLQREAQRLWAGPDAAGAYPVYLEHMHMVVRSGVSLMESAVATCKLLPSSCRFKRVLIDYLRGHAEEERGHDNWLLEDYAVAGGQPEMLLSKIPCSEVANMAGAQYYWIRHHHPVMIMGHIAALETYHPPTGFACYLSKRTGLPLDAFRAIARHEKLDLVHKKEIYELINKLDLTSQEETAVGVSGLHTLKSGIAVLESIRTRAENNRAENKKPLHV